MAARLLRNPAVRYGAPLVLFCVAGMYGLARVTENKVDAMDTRVKKRSERAVQLEMAHKVRGMGVVGRGRAGHMGTRLQS